MAGTSETPKPKHPGNRKPRPLSGRNRKLIQFLAEHPDATLTEAGLAAGFKDNAIIRQRVHDTLKGKTAQQRMAEALEADDELNDAALRFKLREGLKSKTIVRSFDRNGNHVEEFTDDDMQTRRSYLQLIGRWKGLDVTKQEISGPDGGALSIDSLEALKGLSKEDLAKIIKATE